jgi:hypothetical protein
MKQGSKEAKKQRDKEVKIVWLHVEVADVHIDFMR